MTTTTFDDLIQFNTHYHMVSENHDKTRNAPEMPTIKYYEICRYYERLELNDKAGLKINWAKGLHVGIISFETEDIIIKEHLIERYQNVKGLKDMSNTSGKELFIILNRWIPNPYIYTNRAVRIINQHLL